ncbi:MAG TPA: DUF4199 domain-containing protein [Gemmatimonadales bacterium]
MRKIVLTFGLISGLILSVLQSLPFLVPGSHDFDQGMVYGYAAMVLSLLLIYFGVRTYRDQVGGGKVSFGKAFQVGGLIFVIAGLCYVVMWEILYNTVASGFITEYSAHVIEMARAAGATDAAIAEQQAQMAQFAEMYKNPLIRAGMTFLEPLPVGIVFTTLTAWLLSRQKKEVAA